MINISESQKAKDAYLYCINELTNIRDNDLNNVNQYKDTVETIKNLIRTLYPRIGF